MNFDEPKADDKKFQEESILAQTSALINQDTNDKKKRKRKSILSKVPVKKTINTGKKFYQLISPFDTEKKLLQSQISLIQSQIAFDDKKAIQFPDTFDNEKNNQVPIIINEEKNPQLQINDEKESSKSLVSLLLNPKIISSLLVFISFAAYITIFKYIMQNPTELEAVLKELPKDSYFGKKNNSDVIIIDGNEYEVDTIPSTLGISEIFSSINVKETFVFYQYLSKTPLLGLNHEVGKKIFSIIKNIDKKNMVVNLHKTLYHGRKRADNTRVLTEQELFAPPYAVSSFGRYNMQGIPSIYFCDNLDAVLKEIKWQTKDNYVDVMEYYVNNDFTLLDLTDRSCPLINYCCISYGSDLPSYIIPNFIADCCRVNGIDGIKYKSVQDDSSTNFVFFTPSKEHFKMKCQHVWEGDKWENFN